MAPPRRRHTTTTTTTPILLLLALALAVLAMGADAWRLPSSPRSQGLHSRIATPQRPQHQVQGQGLGRAGQRTRRWIWPTPEEEEEMEWPRPLERKAEEVRKRNQHQHQHQHQQQHQQQQQQDPSRAPLREEDGAEELLPTIMVDGQPQKVAYQPDLSITEDLWPVLSTTWRSIVSLGPEGSKRRSAQMTVLSVGAMGLGTVLLFLALLPAGFIHGPTDARTVNSRPTYGTKTYINPDKMLEDDFYRAGGVRMWDDFADDEDY